MMLGTRKAEAMVVKLREGLTEAVMQDVGKRLIEESKIQQKKINAEMAERLKGWDKTIRTRIREIIDEEMTNTPPK